jgi:hypothetical protein
MKRTLAVSTTVLTLSLVGCVATTPEPVATTPAPSAVVTPPAAVPSIAPEPTPDAAVDVEVMKDTWDSAAPAQQQWVRQRIESLGSEAASSVLIEKAGELGYIVTPAAAREFIDWLATQ